MSDDPVSFSTPQPGELLAVPPVHMWPDVLSANVRASAGWDFHVAGVPVRELRRTARAEALAAARSFMSRMGGAFAHTESGVADADARPVVMTGHQPEFFHPGVWVKDFLVDTLARDVGATGIEIVVDSDGFDNLGVTAPCMKPRVHKCSATLATAAADACFACTPTPEAEVVDAFCAEVSEMLATLSSTAPARNFERFCEGLRHSAHNAENLAELVTFARRFYEEPAGTKYLDVPVTQLGATPSFASFAFDLAVNAERFSAAYNDELDAFRKATATRSPAQPFPNLGRLDGAIELPFWVLGGGRRATLWAKPQGGGVIVRADEEVIGKFDSTEVAAFRETMRHAGLAPKALALTLFARIFLSDLFVHGTGGARYDRVTDGVMRLYWGIEPPAFVVASSTQVLSLGVPLVPDEDVSAVIERANRFEHNPDSMLKAASFGSEEEAEEARAFAAEKAALVRDIGMPGADRKELGRRIRELNEALRAALAPVGEELRSQVALVQAQREESLVLGDRTYPFCYWDPCDIAATAR